MAAVGSCFKTSNAAGDEVAQISNLLYRRIVFCKAANWLRHETRRIQSRIDDEFQFD